jgi:hypothetical protein
MYPGASVEIEKNVHSSLLNIVSRWVRRPVWYDVKG